MSKSRPTAISAITLGTAQLGSSYGIANTHGLPSDSDASAIIECALSRGISSFDTARSYGCAEARLGLTLSTRRSEEQCIVTKLEPMTKLAQRTTATEVVASVDASV